MKNKIPLHILTYFFCCFFLNLFLASAQQLYIPRNIQKAYKHGTRSTNGKPGPVYWQNNADYHLKIKFNPKTRLLEGSENIIYLNNSPDTLKTIVIRLYPDYYKKGNLRNVNIDAADESSGVKISLLKIGEKKYDFKDGVQQEGTNLYVRTKIAPASKTNLHIEWRYILNKGSHIRTGQVDEGSYFIAYCFPRIAVYDDIDGWDRTEYLGNDEPYFDFGNFNAEISVPKNFMVWATGTLTNSKDVLSNKVYYMIERAMKSNEEVTIIDSNDIAQKNVTAQNKWNTFKFEAKNVPDFAFALSNHYMWQASSMDVYNTGTMRVLVGAAFNKTHKDYFDVHRASRKSIELMSFDFPGYPYPYEHITVFDGLDQMEYPMMVNDNPTSSWEELVTLTVHEIMHTYFPFMMGTNQTKYGWMDEGWATIGEWIISSKIDSAIIDLYGIEDVNNLSGKEKDLPTIINSYHITDRSHFLNNYPKPALAYLYLRDWLGETEFKKSLLIYMNDWRGKHPMPHDFFNSFNISSGKNLDWYWKRWFYDWGYPDLAIENVVKETEGYKISIRAIGNKPVPVNISVEFADGTSEKLHHACNVWMHTDLFTLTLPSQKGIKKITMGDTYDVDIDKSNNIYYPGK